MQEASFINWLKEKGLFSQISANYSCFSRIFEDHFKIKKRDSLLIIGDCGEPMKRTAAIVTGCYLIAAKRLGLQYKLVLQKPKYPGDKSDLNVIHALDNLQDGNFITISVSGKLGSLSRLGKSFRKIVHDKRFKFVSTLNLSELPTTRLSYLVDAIDIDYPKLQTNAARIERILTHGSRVKIMTKAGTNLEIGIAGMKAIPNDGKFHTKSGNIPVGEVYLPPRRDQVDGRLVIDGSVKTRWGTHIITGSPVSLIIKKGRVMEIIGNNEAAKKLRETLDWAEKKSKHHWGVRRIGELGIGINPKAKIVGPTIINEKALGTAHIAIGSNAWFGGTIYSIIHLDQVFKNPQIWVDGKKLII